MWGRKGSVKVGMLGREKKITNGLKKKARNKVGLGRRQQRKGGEVVAYAARKYQRICWATTLGINSVIAR